MGARSGKATHIACATGSAASKTPWRSTSAATTKWRPDPSSRRPKRSAWICRHGGTRLESTYRKQRTEMQTEEEHEDEEVTPARHQDQQQEQQEQPEQPPPTQQTAPLKQVSSHARWKTWMKASLARKRMESKPTDAPVAQAAPAHPPRHPRHLPLRRPQREHQGTARRSRFPNPVGAPAEKRGGRGFQGPRWRTAAQQETTSTKSSKSKSRSRASGSSYRHASLPSTSSKTSARASSIPKSASDVWPKTTPYSPSVAAATCAAAAAAAASAPSAKGTLKLHASSAMPSSSPSTSPSSSSSSSSRAAPSTHWISASHEAPIRAQQTACERPFT